MNATLTGEAERPIINISLSRRNLEHLLKMLDMQTGITELCRRCDNINLYVRAEENQEHYGEREPGIGAEDYLNYFDPRIDHAFERRARARADTNAT